MSVDHFVQFKNDIMKPELTISETTIRRSLSLLILFFSLLAFTGCASIKFYSDADLKRETGLRYYTLKPYLLVEYKANKDNSVKTNVVYLPDLADPQYVKITSGLGSTELKMSFENSSLTSYGIAKESEISDLLESFAAMLSKSAYAAQTFTGERFTEPDEDEIYFRLFEIITDPEGTRLREVLPGK